MNSKHYKNRGITPAKKVILTPLDNRNRIVKKKCAKCGKAFETKEQCGFTNCKKCNGVK
jgi:hypothetical protein